MAWRFVLQPNGKIALFTDVRDDFTHEDLSEREALMLAESYGLSERLAKEKVQGALEDWPPYKRYVKGSRTDRWTDCMDTLRRVHGDEKANIIEAAHRHSAKQSGTVTRQD